MIFENLHILVNGNVQYQQFAITGICAFISHSCLIMSQFLMARLVSHALKGHEFILFFILFGFEFKSVRG